MKEERLGRDFFTVDGLTLAKGLLGKIMVHETPYGKVRGIITETEGYMGVMDKGAHTYGGKRTSRTEPMFHIGGTSYVYLIYGMYSCMNIAANVEGIPEAALIRMLEPADDLSREIMSRYRNGNKHLADGPGKLCIAMNISKVDNDIDMVESDTFYLTTGIDVAESQIKAGKRINIDYAEEAADYLWRFTI